MRRDIWPMDISVQSKHERVTDITLFSLDNRDIILKNEKVEYL